MPKQLIIISQPTLLDTMTMSQRSNYFTYEVFSVPTKGGDDSANLTQKKAKAIDTSYLNEEDLQTLKKHDPFLYYSIPAVRTATHLSRDVDMSRLNCGMSSSPQIESAPSTKVERQSRISFECHTDVILEGLIEDMDDWNMPPNFEKQWKAKVEEEEEEEEEVWELYIGERDFFLRVVNIILYSHSVTACTVHI